METHSNLKYPFRLNLCVRSVTPNITRAHSCFLNAPSYDKPPIEDITIEEFETAALDRLRVLAEIESCYARNRTFKEMQSVIMDNVCQKYLELNRTTHQTKLVDVERRKDHIGHFVLRLAFCRSCVVSLIGPLWGNSSGD